jgi:hypothetical protein
MDPPTRFVTKGQQPVRAGLPELQLLIRACRRAEATTDVDTAHLSLADGEQAPWPFNVSIGVEKYLSDDATRRL